jgi:broad specificity phosphatase PhoE
MQEQARHETPGEVAVKASRADDELHPLETVTSILFLRHGHTAGTERGLLYSDPATELTEKGCNQAEQLGLWMRSQAIDGLFSSSSKRVLSTAQIIGKLIDMAPSVVSNLNEWNVGDWEGKAYVDIKANEPALYQAWVNDPIVNSPPGGESIHDVYLRTEEKVKILLASNPGKTIALVTHAGIIRAAILHALKMNVHDFWRLVIPVGSVSRIDYSDNFAALQYMSLQP